MRSFTRPRSGFKGYFNRTVNHKNKKKKKKSSDNKEKNQSKDQKA